MYLLTIAVTLALCCHMIHTLEQEQRDHILKIHNDYRKNVPYACQMNRMNYDMELEAAAQAWANRCVFSHEIVKGRGENLAWNTAKADEKVLMNKASKSWYDEVNIYSYGQYSCGSACHYTQMVWDKTDKVGCATNRCRYLVNAYSDAWYLVCFYLPGGNDNGVKPYQTSCDSPCREGQTQDAEGLCVDSADDSGTDDSDTGSDDADTDTQVETGPTTEQPCDNKNPRCDEWANNSQCHKNPKYMHKKCRQACGICGNVCKDLDTECPKWAKSGECKRNADYMLTFCKESCNQC